MEENTEYAPRGPLEKLLYGGISSENKVVRNLTWPLAFYYAGPLFGEEGHREFAVQLYKNSKKTRHGKPIPPAPRLTRDHALGLGLVGMSLEGIALVWLGQEVKEAMIPAAISTFFDISYNAGIGIYISTLGFVQNFGRYEYGKKMIRQGGNKGMGAIGLFPALFNFDYYIPRARKITKIFGKKYFRKVKRETSKLINGK